MPQTCIDTADAIELAETLQLIAGWPAADPERVTASLLAYIGHPACGPDAGALTWTASPSSSAATTASSSSAKTRPDAAVPSPASRPRLIAADAVTETISGAAGTMNP